MSDLTRMERLRVLAVLAALSWSPIVLPAVWIAQATGLLAII
jgi:hypothetical protein